MANEFVAKNGLISQNNTTISGSLTVSASSGIPLQIKGGTGTLLSVSSSTSEIFKISDTFSPNLFTVSTGSITVFNIDNNKTVSISGSLVVTGSITGSLLGTASFATLAQTSNTASYVVTATTASYVLQAVSASYAATTSFAPNYVLNSATNSFVTNTQTSSFVQNSQTSSMTVATASYVSGAVHNSNNPALSASYAATASYVTASNIAGTVLSSSYAQTSSVASTVVGATPTEIGYLSGVTSAVQTQLNSKGYTLGLTSVASNLVSGTTYYFGNLGRAIITTADQSRVYIPKTGTIKKAYISHYSATTGTITSISASIRLNNTTDTLIATSTANSNFRTFNNNALSISVTEGDYIEMKVTSVNSVAPTANVFGGTIYIE